jgi:hypothetical protein
VLLQELTEQQAGPLVLPGPPEQRAEPLALPGLPERQAWLLLATWGLVAPLRRMPLPARVSTPLLSRKDEMLWV